MSKDTAESLKDLNEETYRRYKTIAESLHGLHAEATRLGLPMDLVTHYFTTLATSQRGAVTDSTKEAEAPARRKPTSVREFVQKVYPDLRPELLVVLCRFYGEPFTDLDEAVNRMVMDGRFYWDAKKTPEPVTDSMVVHAGRRIGSTTLCRLVAAYEIIRRLEELEYGVEGGPYNVHLRTSDLEGIQGREQAVRQVSEWVKSFDPRVNSHLGKGHCSQNVRFMLSDSERGISLMVDCYSHGLQASREFTNPKYGLFISDADVIECADFVGEKCRSFEVFTSKWKPHAKNPNTLQVYTDLYAQGRAMSIFGIPYASPACVHLKYDVRWESSPIRL